MERQYRKYEDYLLISGYGVTLFGFWNILKSVLYATIGRADFVNRPMVANLLNSMEKSGMVGQAGAGQQMQAVDTLFFILFISAIIAYLLRYYIYRSAVAEASGKKKGWFYVILSIVLFIASVYSLIQSIAFGYTVTVDADYIVTIILDITSTLSLLQFAVSAIMIKKLGKDMEVQEDAA